MGVSELSAVLSMSIRLGRFLTLRTSELVVLLYLSPCKGRYLVPMGISILSAMLYLSARIQAGI
jgi:hypothetical protein